MLVWRGHFCPPPFAASQPLLSSLRRARLQPQNVRDTPRVPTRINCYPQMNLQCQPNLAASYKSRSQIARILTEDWCERELYCAACPSNTLRKAKANAATVDFFCAKCEQPYQLKSRRNAYTSKITDAAYDPMIRAIRQDRTPNLLFLQYSNDWAVSNLLLVPAKVPSVHDNSCGI